MAELYTVKLKDGGEIRVLANSPQDAVENSGAGDRAAGVSGPSGGGGGGGGGGADEQLSQIARAVVESNRERWELARDQALLDMQLARNADQRAEASLRLAQAESELNKLKFEEAKRQFDVSTFGDMARSLLSAAVNLRGPADYFRAQTLLAGGRNIFDALRSQQAVPVGAAPRGFIEPANVQRLLQQLGLAPGGQAALTPAQQQQQFQVPLPHQVNPARFDELGPVGQALTLAAAEQGLTPGGAFDPEEYLRQLNATRPQGTAARQTQFAFAPTAGLF